MTTSEVYSCSVESGNIAALSNFIEAASAKGPTYASENLSKQVKEFHRKLASHCKPVSEGVLRNILTNAPGKIIVLSEGPPRTIGCPPGNDSAMEFAKIEAELLTCQHRYLRSDRTQSPRAVACHNKLRNLLSKIKVVLECQRLQCALDHSVLGVRLALRGAVSLRPIKEIEGVNILSGQIEEVERRHRVATEKAVHLASTSAGNAMVLTPTGGWEEALEAAKGEGYLNQDFPSFLGPLSNVAGLEISRIVVRKRQGIRKVEVAEGRVRLLSTPEYEKLLENAVGDQFEHESGTLCLVPTISSPTEIISAAWINYREVPYYSRQLLQIELSDVGRAREADLLSMLQSLQQSWRWFQLNLVHFLRMRRRYKGMPLDIHVGYEEIMEYPRVHIKCLAESWLDQLTGGGPYASEIEEIFQTIIEVVHLGEEEFIQRAQVDGDDDDEGDYEDSVFEGDYLQLGAEVLHPPPVNPDYEDPSGPTLRVERPQGEEVPRGGEQRRPAGEELARAPSLPPPRPPSQDRGRRAERIDMGMAPNVVAQRGRPTWSRSSSRDSGPEGGVPPGRSSPAATTASQIRGEDKTHTLALQIQRARTMLVAIEASPDSTRYKVQREKVRDLLKEAERHLREDSRDVSLSYEGLLGNQMELSEEVCSEKDDELDRALKAKKEVEEQRKNLLAALPRGLGQKFSGLAQDWPTFREHFVRINNSMDASLAVAQMIQLVDDSKLKRRMKIYTSGDDIIRDFDSDFGHSFLNCQNVIHKVNQSKPATELKGEMDLIIQYKQAKRTLDKNADREKLLNITQLLQWGDKLLPSTNEELLKIAQASDFGSKYSPVQPFFDYLDQVYERSSVLTRNRESWEPVKSGGSGQGKRSDKAKGETTWRAYGSEGGDGGGCKAFCSTGQAHRPHNCPLLASGQIGLKRVKKEKLCTCCVAPSDLCKKGVLKRKDGTSFSIACHQCGHSKKVACHQNCKKKDGQSNPKNAGVSFIDGPPVEIPDPGPGTASLTELRTELTVSSLANSNPMGSASEMADQCVLVAPDGARKLVRVLYDWGATDSILSFKLGRFFHHFVPTRVGVNGANSSKSFRSHVGELRLMKSDGTCIPLKAIKGDLSGRAFTLKPKTVDIPYPLHCHFEGTVQDFNDMGDLRVGNLTEDSRVELVIGLDACALAPFELARWHDNHGQTMLYRSVISNKVIVTGSRRTGAATTVSAGTSQRTYAIVEEGNRPVSLLRASVDFEDSRDLFVKRANLTKIEKKLFSHIEDCDEIVPPLPSLCRTCEGCEICRDPFKKRNQETVIKLLDQLVTFREGKREDGGGFHVRLLFDPDILVKVPEGRSAALRRLLATEKQLTKPGMESARENFNKKVQACRDKGYLVGPEQLPGISSMQKAYMPFSFALKDEEKLGESAGVGNPAGAPPHKTKARPVVDCSAIAEPGQNSVNQAQFKIPDPHTSKITELLLRLRTAKRFCLGDISEYYFRLWCDPLTSSLTRVLFRDGGLGGTGEIVELISVVSSMGLKQIPTFASHVRYRLSLLIESKDPEGARQLRESYADDIHLAERFGACRKRGDEEHICEDGEVLTERAQLVERILNDAHLFLGDKWITDVRQEKCPSTMTGVTAGSQEVEVTLGNSGQTSALGYRLHLGHQQPDGGALLWRVHRPQSLNLEPKSRGARPDWAQLASSTDIRTYLKQHGVSKANLLSLCSNLYDPLLLAAPFISSARLLFRQVLREVSLPNWRSTVPERYHEKIALLAEDLLQVAKKMKVPRLAVTPTPVKKEQHSHPYGFATLLVVSDGSCEAGVAAAYIHQQFPFESASRPSTADFSDVTVTCNLLCAALKLTDNHNSQVDGELLGKFLSCRLGDFVTNHALIDFHRVRHCSDSLTIERAIRKSDACYSTWAGRRIAYIQQAIDVDDSWHIPHEITDGTVDSCTKQQKQPSLCLNGGWFHGEGILDKPLQMLPFTARATYSQPRISDLPAQWLSSTARSFLGLKLPAVLVMRMEVGGEETPESSILEKLANKYSSTDAALSVFQFLLKMKKSFRELPAQQQRSVCRDRFVGEDYDKISQQLQQRSTRLTQQLALKNDSENKTFTMKGRFGYEARLLANPKSSAYSRLVLRSSHNSHHLTSSARILAKVGRDHVFTGGALKYLDRLRAECTICRLLKPQAVKMLLGDTPPFMHGPLPEATTTWTHQSADIFGPIFAQAFPRAKGTRAATKRLKIWGLLVFDYASRAVDAQICDTYSADSVILALKAVWSRVGRPKFLNCDAAANLASANDILGGEDGSELPSLAEGERLQEELKQQLGNQIEMRPRVPFAPHRQASERSIQFCKRKLRQMLHHEAGRLLTPIEASSILSCAVAYVNERVLVINAAPDEQGVLTPWFLSPRNMSTYHSQRVEGEEDLEHPLSRRAFQAQQRLQLFKGQFDVFYHKQLVRFGHWNTSGKVPDVGDVVLIMDKDKGKVNFVRKFQLGRVNKILSPHVCEITFVKQDPAITAALIKDLRNHSNNWRLQYRVKTSTCTRDMKGLTILCSLQQENHLREGFEADIFMEHHRVTDIAQDEGEGNGEALQALNQERGEHALLEEDVLTGVLGEDEGRHLDGVRKEDQRPVDEVAHQRKGSVIEEEEAGHVVDNLAESNASVPVPAPASGLVKTKRKKVKERWVLQQ